MRVAIIDIGSSSVKLFIGEDVNGEIKIVESLKTIIDLGKGTFYKGSLPQEVFSRTITTLENYKKIIQEYEVSQVKVIATTAVREASNRNIFLDAVTHKTGFTVEVLNAGDIVYYIDTFLSYKLNKTYPIHERNLLIAELGSGTLDISVMEKGFILVNIGMPLGTLRIKQLKAKIDASQEEMYQALQEFVEIEIGAFRRTLDDLHIDDIILIDEGYSSALQKLMPAKNRPPNFFKFTYRESRQLLAKLTEESLEDVAEKYNLAPDLAETMDVYAIILNQMFRLIKSRSIYILETSLSEALLSNIISGGEQAKKYDKTNQLVSLANFLCQKYKMDIRHAKQVAGLSDTLFQALKETLGLKDHHALYMTLAAYLHDIGLFINNRSHHKHAEYVISSLNLFRLTEREIRIIACVARYHRRASPQRTHYLYSFLSEVDQILVQKLSSILRIANALDSSHKQKAKKLECVLKPEKEVSLTVHTQGSLVIQQMKFAGMKELFEEITGLRIKMNIKKSGISDVI